MSSLRGIFLLLVPNLAGVAMAEPTCIGDWEYQARMIEAGDFTAPGIPIELGNGLSFKFAKDDRAPIVIIEDEQKGASPIREVSRGIAPVRGQNPQIRHYVFGPDVLDPALNPDLTVPGGANMATVEPTPGYRGQVWVAPQSVSKRKNSKSETIGTDEHRACLRWTYFPRDVDTSHYSSPDALVNFPGWVVRAFEDCGLDKSYLLSGRMPRPGYRNSSYLEPDLDGDGLHDLVALVYEAETGRSRLAICSQADRSLEIIGLGQDALSDALSSAFLGEIEWWSVNGRMITLGGEATGSINVFRDPSGVLSVQRTTE